jgi:hypothetical protein
MQDVCETQGEQNPEADKGFDRGWRNRLAGGEIGLGAASSIHAFKPPTNQSMWLIRGSS